ncbi:MAG: D-alanyl-D-alanine carboxypeptidase/D-alanyl-D-alanine-endopeptidase [Polyangiaceae bacterium]
MGALRRFGAIALLSWLGGASAWAEPAPLTTPNHASQTAQGELKAELADFVRWVESKQGHCSVRFVDLASGAPVVEHDATRPLNPASNLKLFTAAASLVRLGPAARLRTVLLGSMQSDGSVPELALQGEGDPDLRREHLDALARELAQRGVRRVSGPIVVDGSAFDAQTSPPGFEAQPAEQAAFRAPVAALSVDRNAVVIFVEPGTEAQAARVWTADGVLPVEGTVSTAKRGAGDRVRAEVVEHAGALRVRVSGRIAVGLPTRRYARRVDSPALFVGTLLRDSLRRMGVATTEAIVAGKRQLPLLATHESPPVAQLLVALGKDSDNFTAEMLLKVLGARATGQPGSSAGGAADVLAVAQSLGVPPAQLEVRNGSGLFDGGRASALALTELLRRGARDPRLGPDFVAQLSIGGVDGTLRSRFRTQAPSRRLRAKTGTLARAVALSGYLLADGNHPGLAFSLLVQGARASHAEIRARMDQVVARAAAF